VFITPFHLHITPFHVLITPYILYGFSYIIYDHTIIAPLVHLDEDVFIFTDHHYLVMLELNN